MVTGTSSLISPEMSDDKSASIIEKDGFIIVSVAANAEALALMGDDVLSSVETYTIDAKTREMTTVKTVYTYKDGTVEEGVITITRDVEAPEGTKPDQETENLRKVTIVSNPGAENENTECIQVAKGLQVTFAADYFVEESFTLYADAACTQIFEDEWDVNTDLTIYVKWGE